MTITTAIAGAVRPMIAATSNSTGSEPTDPWTNADTLLAELAAMPENDCQRGRLRDQIICECAGAARREAKRYRHTGENSNDLAQVATLGLILAVDRYDPGRGISFKYFALPTISGELKRHFRDKSWSVKVTRRVQELYYEVHQAEPLLAQALGRMPSNTDLADHLGLSEEDVRAARTGEAAYATRSLNRPSSRDEDAIEIGERIGAPDPEIEAVPDRDALRRALPLLPERLRMILCLRFVDNLSQTQIADKMGISQMHVSRLITRSLAQLRRHMTAE
jgi:RNA polymerase sigma-B factor